MERKAVITEKTCRVAELSAGDKIVGAVFLVEMSNFKQTRNQKYFLQMSLRDSSGSVRAVRWEATHELYASFGADDFLRVNGRVEEFQGQPQIIVDSLERLDDSLIDHSRFLPVSDRPIEEMERELEQAVSEVKRAELRALLEAIVADAEVREGLRRCPAGKSLHHAWIGGLLEHIVSLLAASRAVASVYPRLDRDLLYAASILHDVGKIEELSYRTNFGYTDRGQLVGHIALGLDLLNRKAAEIEGFPLDLLTHLQHIVASHHGLPEYGALKLPMTAEAIAFHYLDNLDAKVSSLDPMEASLPRDPAGGKSDSGGRWTEYKPHLGRKIFFPPRAR